MAVMEKDDEDAICRRTRARYSLAGFTLDELETFLQETDDEDDVQNVDDEEEYKKFLAAVLQGAEGNSANAQDHENVDDEDDDEDNDADFELEIEEALESDLDVNLKDDIGEGEAIKQRPKTRLSWRQKSSVEHIKKASGESSRQLRPLLPYSPIASYSAFAGKGLVPRTTPICLSSPNGLINGFTPYQIGQLHSLIHEHVQLLIQTFSLCVLDPAKQYIAPDVHKLISELLCKRDEMLAQGRAPYPQVCFIPKHIHSSMDGSAPDILPRRTTNGLSSASDMQGDCSAALNRVEPSNCTSPSTGQLVYASTEQDGCLRFAEGSSWMPYINDKTVTVLDVAPLKLVRKFLDDVSVAKDCQRRHLGATCDVSAEKVPLFPASDTQLSAEADRPALLPLPMSKKTLAASLVERAKKQSIALVPKEIAKLAKPFCPLFNPVLYPHKAPPAAVVNRVLFTDAEDKLLALGVMEYNTDWKAIQQQFLPCKSMHQIFVRQKNRSSSKAPENLIKAARRIKKSPLTSEEIARIEEGLRVFKLDWMSVWKFFVPHRDPSMLPRQWRIATGTQKSYRSNAEKKERRRLYESQKRKCKAAALEILHPSSEKLDTGSADNFGEKNSADDCTDKDSEAYVHEAFLADSRACLPIISSEARLPDIVNESYPHTSQVDGSQVGEKINEHVCRDHLPQINRSSRTEVLFMRPYRARKSSTPRMVKLSPELPPVNLPPTARVMSFSALKTNQSVLPQTRFSSGAKAASSKKEVLSNTTESNMANHEESESLRDRHVAEEKDCPDLQMHPLLFRAPKDCNLLHQGNSGPDANSSFTIFPGSPPQLNLSLYRHTDHALNVSNKALKPNGKASTSSGLCFHPLLQRTTDKNSVAQPPSASSDLPREMVTQPIANYSERIEIEMHSTLLPRKEKALEKCVSRSSQIISDSELMSQSTFKRPSTDFDSSAQAMVASNETDMVNNADDILAHSLQGIVMEQEELSDSEEEEENVEFECEEMTDSEGEEEIPPSVQMTNEQIEETDRAASDEGSDEHVPVPPVTCGNPEENSCSPFDDTITTQLGPGSSSPNTNSFPPFSRRANPKVTTRQKLAGSKRSGLNAEMEKPASGNEQGEVKMGDFVSLLKNSRKRACNTGSKTNVGQSRKGVMPSLNSDLGIESSKKANEVEIS